MPRVVDPKGWEKPTANDERRYVPGTFDLRSRPVAPKQTAPGAWEAALARIAGGQTMPPVYEPLPTTSRLRQKRRAQVAAKGDQR